MRHIIGTPYLQDRAKWTMLRALVQLLTGLNESKQALCNKNDAASEIYPLVIVSILD